MSKQEEKQTGKVYKDLREISLAWMKFIERIEDTIDTSTPVDDDIKEKP